MSSFKLFAGPQDFTQSFFFGGEKTNADATLFVCKNRQKSLITRNNNSLNVAETFGFTVKRKSLYDRLKNPLIELPIKLIKHSVWPYFHKENCTNCNTADKSMIAFHWNCRPVLFQPASRMGRLPLTDFPFLLIKKAHWKEMDWLITPLPFSWPQFGSAHLCKWVWRSRLRVKTHFAITRQMNSLNVAESFSFLNILDCSRWELERTDSARR